MASDASRWRFGRPGHVAMSARLLLRSLRLRSSSFLLALLAVTVGATVSATMLDLKADLREKMSRELRRYGPNLLVTASAGSGSPTLDEGAARRLPSLLAGPAPGVIVSPILLSGGAVAAGSAPADAAEAGVAGVDFESLARLNPAWRLEGAWPRSSESACLVGTSLARTLALHPGGEAILAIGPARERLRVAGILSTGESEDGQILVPLPLLQERLGLPGRVSVAVLSVDGGATSVARAATRIQDGIPGVSARPLWQVAAPQGALLGTLDTLMLFLTLVVLVLCGLSVMTTLLSIVLERQEEIGLMRSLGAGDGEILTMFLAEVSLLAILGSAGGLALGAGAARLVGHRLFGAAIVPRAVVVPLVLAVSLALCWSAVIVPLRRALAIQPAAALRGE